MHAHHVLVGCLASLALLAGCTAGGPGPFPGGGVLAGTGPSVTVAEGRAPSATRDKFTVRADEVTRVGDEVAVGLTIATASDHDTTLYGGLVGVLTNTGTRISADAGEDRLLPGRSTVAANLSVPLPDEPVSELTIRVKGSNGLAVTVPVPPGDGSIVWRPAPLRQVGLAPRPLRSSHGEVVVDAVRSEGLLTEVEFHATGLNDRALAVCEWWRPCTLTESDGTEHPLVGGPDVEHVARDARVRGSLVFLGELDPAATDLTLAVAGTVTGELDPLRITLPTHADSPTLAAAGDLTRPAMKVEPVTLRDAETGAEITVTGLDVLSDHIQLHVAAKAGDHSFDLLRATAFERSALIEPNGSRHRLQPPSDGSLTLREGDTLEAALVFQGSVPATVTQLTLELGSGSSRGRAVTTTFTLPAADRAEPVTEATLGQVAGEAGPAPSPRVRPEVPQPTAQAGATATPRPTVGALLFTGITPLPQSHYAVIAPVRTAIKGVTPQGQPAGTSVDADTESAAQRRLQDLGAQRTPDGWVLTLPETVLFDYNQDTIRQDACTKLGEVARLLTHYDRATIAVQGHTDDTGSREHNADLSLRRARAVATALSDQGISSGRMTVEGFGSDRPVASNADDAGKARNRRVEVVLRETA